MKIMPLRNDGDSVNNSSCGLIVYGITTFPTWHNVHITDEFITESSPFLSGIISIRKHRLLFELSPVTGTRNLNSLLSGILINEIGVQSYFLLHPLNITLTISDHRASSHGDKLIEQIEFNIQINKNTLYEIIKVIEITKISITDKHMDRIIYWGK